MLNRSIKRTGRYLALAAFATLAPAAVESADYDAKTASPQGQQENLPAASTRADVDNLLAHARAEMAAGQLEKADAILRRAESAKVNYPFLHFGDSPPKVRHDLQKLLAKQSGAEPDSRKTNPLAAILSRRNKESTDPFIADLTQERSSPSTPESLAQEMPQQLGLPQTTSPTSPREMSDAKLFAARQALAVGDSAQAEQHLEAVRQLNVAYLASDDSPEKITQSIADYHQLATSKDNSPSWRLAYTKYLVSQANALLFWNDLDSAERTANEAATLSSDLSLEGVSPIDVLTRIARIRAGAIEPTLTNDTPESIADAKTQTLHLLAEARAALESGNLPQAEKLAGEASRLGVADSQFAPHEDRPSQMAADAQRARIEQQQVILTNNAAPLALRLPNASLESSPRLAQADSVPSPLPAPTETIPPSESPLELMKQGEAALRNGDRNRALSLFQTAHQYQDQLDPLSQEKLQDHLQMLSSSAQTPTPPAADGSLLDSASLGQSVVARQLSSEVGKHQSEASKLRTSDPKRALEILRQASQQVASSELDENMKTQLARRIELSLAETERYIRDNQATIELDEANREILEDIDRQRAIKLRVQEKVAELVEQFNSLRDEQRYAEMEVVAKRLYDMAPDEPVAQQVWENAKFIRRSMLNREIEQLTEEGVVRTFQGIRKDAADALVSMQNPITYDAEHWTDFVDGRQGSSRASTRRTERELEIERKLRIPVLPRYDNMPLSDVIEGLSDLTGVNIHLDARGLGQEGVRNDVPVTLNLGQEISLESALSLILEPLHLTYIIKDEVIKVTSEELSDGETYHHVYNVADLVIPIPNFVPSTNMGLQGLINDAYAAIPRGNQGVGVPEPMTVAVNGRPGQEGAASGGGNALAQQLGAGGTGSAPISNGPGGLGGAASADFDSLIDLIVSTVEYDSWMENGTGEGEIQPFPTNLSLVISQTQRVHEQIADLLEQLRRLQDLQVTIEVRFIRLTDSFFERIGIDFDFNIEDGSEIDDLNGVNPSFEPQRSSATLGISSMPIGLSDPLPQFTADLDVPYRNSSFGLTVPQFGSPQAVGEFGFAILSDIEAFFLINASQGDQRANILQAPKVTLFNGQQAIVLDTAFMPFVISVIPVVGEFAAAQQPVIVVLSEGTMMTVQAVVSDDRRYVRLTLVPFFSQIGDVQEFTFEGTETSSSSSASTDQDDDGTGGSEEATDEIIRSGTTVQLPTFEVISVSTTVSVPDGGTVLLGGIKRLREGRNEFGVPLLGKLPYIDRLFRNVGIGRDTDSLMMMVTPHIIIQEEEEERLGIAAE